MREFELYTFYVYEFITFYIYLIYGNMYMYAFENF